MIMIIFLIILKVILFLGISIYFLIKYDPKFIHYIIFMISILVYSYLNLIIGQSITGTYKEGQIDAINGKINYKLNKQSDSTTQWIKINLKLK